MKNQTLWLVVLLAAVTFAVMAWQPKRAQAAGFSARDTGATDTILNWFKGLAGNTEADSGADNGPFGNISQSP